MSTPRCSTFFPYTTLFRSRFELVYDKEIQVYRNNFAYPRAFVVHNLVQADDPDNAIRQLAQAKFNPSTQAVRSEEHTSELQSLRHLVCRLLLEKKKKSLYC